MVFVTCWLAFIAVSSIIGRFTKNRCDKSDNTENEDDILVNKETRKRKRKNTEPHEHRRGNKVRRKEVHAQWLNNLSNCTEVKVLGEGAFEKVTHYHHKITKMDYAVKEMNEFDPDSYAMEKKILNLGNSNHFLSALCGEFSYMGCRYLVMEFMLAGDLQKVFMLHKRIFSEMQARFYIMEIICGLQYLHMQGVVHRDLKLPNVLMDEEGHLKLADFGLAVDNMWPGEKIQEDCESGTPPYMAPEVIKHQPYDSSCDWWSLGVMLYCMLASKMPFRKKVLQDLYNSICTDEVKYTKLSDVAWNLVTQLLEKNPMRRIGYKCGSNPWIRSHGFFQSINWDQLEQRKIKPPWNPRESIFGRFLFRLRRYIKHSRQCFIGYPNTSSFVKNTPLGVVFSTLFSVFGYPDETLSLVFEILLEHVYIPSNYHQDSKKGLEVIRPYRNY